MVEKLFNEGDVIQLKPKEELKKIINEYWHNDDKDNEDYLNGIIEACKGKTIIIDKIRYYEMFNGVKTYIITSNIDTIYALYQEFFVSGSDYIDNDIPDLFG